MASNFQEVTKQVCPNCNEENEPKALLCEYCEERLPVEPSPAELTRGTWTCSCSFVNSYSAEECVSCGARHTERASTYSPDDPFHKSDKVKRASIGNDDDDHDSGSSLFSKVEKLIKKHSQKGSFFTDTEFPACDKSLHSEDTDPEAKLDIASGWLRPSQIKSSFDDDEPLSWTVFDQPKCSDVVQGCVGNCWFITALAVIAEKPHLLNKIFVTKEYNPQGVYGLRLFADGKWEDIIVDDLFPVDDMKRLIYSKAKRKQLWVPLAEKALAKMYGCYSALCTGSQIQAMNFVTGCACHTVNLAVDLKDTLDKSLLYQELRFAIQEGLPITGGTNAPNISVEQYESVALLTKHTHAILTVTSIYGQELVLINNLWGSGGWTGEWSEHSKLWKSIPTELRPAEGIGSQALGIFWMSLDDLIKYFREITICYARKNYHSLCLKSKFLKSGERHWEIFQVKLEDSCAVDLNLQVRNKFVKSFHSPRAVMMILDNNWNVIGCTNNEFVFETFWTSPMLVPGKYIVCCLSFSKWYLPEAKYNFICHSSRKVKCSILNVESSLVAKVLMKVAIHKGESVSDLSCGQQTYIYDLQYPPYLGRITAVVNRSPNQAIYIATKPCSSYSNVVSTRSDNCEETSDLIPPGHCQIIQALHAKEFPVGEINWDYDVGHKVHERVRFTGCRDVTHQPALSSKSKAVHRLMPNTEID